MKIIELRAKNVKRLTAVQINPGSGPVVVIGGRNGQGKSSTLDSIEYALAGKSSHPSEPIRKGQRRASSHVVLGDDGEPALVVERTFTQGGSQLVVKDANGEKQKGPQQLLDKLCSAIAFDPLSFSRLRPAEQAQRLRELVGLDTFDLDVERSELYDKRTETNRQIKRLRAQLERTTAHDDAPGEEVSVAKLTDELQRRQSIIEDHKRQRLEAEMVAGDVDKAIARAESCMEEVERLEELLSAAKRHHEAAVGDLADVRVRAENAAAEAAELVDPNIDEVRESLRGAEAINAKVRENRERGRLQNELSKIEEGAELLTERIGAIDEKKASALAAADMPIEGLGFDEDGVTLDGIPFAQASQAEQLRLSVAMGFAWNPDLRVLLVRDGSLLDEDSMRMLAELAAEHDGQLWIERVSSTGEGCSVVIEDGSVAGGDDVERERGAA